MVVGYFDGASEIDVARVKEGEVFVSHVPATAHTLVIEAVTSPTSIFRSVGGRRIRMSAKLQPNGRYNVNLIRSDQNVGIWISDASGAAVSERLSFDIEHPFIKPPLIIPIP